MSEAVTVALIAGPLGAATTLLLGRWLGRRRDSVEIDDLVAEKWKEWADELEKRVAKLEHDLAEERKANANLQHQNERLRRLLTSLIRWAIQMRDALIQLDSDVPPAPADVEEALTTLYP